MSQGNVATVRRALDAYVRRDIAAMRELTRDDVVLDWSASNGWLAGVYHGIHEMMRFYGDFWAAFERIELNASYLPVAEHVVVPTTARLWGRDGVEVTARSAFVFTLQNGKIAGVRLHQEKDEALKAVGLEE